MSQIFRYMFREKEETEKWEERERERDKNRERKECVTLQKISIILKTTRVFRSSFANEIHKFCRELNFIQKLVEIFDPKNKYRTQYPGCHYALFSPFHNIFSKLWFFISHAFDVSCFCETQSMMRGLKILLRDAVYVIPRMIFIPLMSSVITVKPESSMSRARQVRLKTAQAECETSACTVFASASRTNICLVADGNHKLSSSHTPIHLQSQRETETEEQREKERERGDEKLQRGCFPWEIWVSATKHNTIIWFVY